MKQYLIRIVFVPEVSCKFSFVTFNMAPLLGISFSFSDLISSALSSRTLFLLQILTNIPSSMTSTIFLSIFGFISILLLCWFVNKVLTIIKICPHQEHVHTSLPPCWLPLPFDSRFNTKVTTHFTVNVWLPAHGYLSKVK